MALIAICQAELLLLARLNQVQKLSRILDQCFKRTRRIGEDV
jgi:hypothetical protein